MGGEKTVGKLIFFRLLPKQTVIYIWTIFRAAAIPHRPATYVPDQYFEGRKLYIIFPCLFDKNSYLDYASFYLSYQDGLNDIG